MSLKKTVVAISTILLFAIALFIYSSMNQSVINKGNKTIASVVPYGGPPPSSPLA
jgi:hypothetical protein